MGGVDGRRVKESDVCKEEGKQASHVAVFYLERKKYSYI